MPACRAARDDHKIRRRAITAGRNGQSIFQRELAAIAFVAHDGVLAAKLIVALQRRAFEDPVLGTMHRVARLAIHELSVTLVVSAKEKSNACQLVLGPRHQVMTPQRREQAMLA